MDDGLTRLQEALVVKDGQTVGKEKDSLHHHGSTRMQSCMKVFMPAAEHISIEETCVIMLTCSSVHSVMLTAVTSPYLTFRRTITIPSAPCQPWHDFGPLLQPASE